jgi:hypothetical protein
MARQYDIAGTCFLGHDLQSLFPSRMKSVTAMASIHAATGSAGDACCSN